MQGAKAAVSEFLHRDKKHTVDIEQETKAAVVHERVAQQQQENVVTAVDREIHQHHHQIHVQPIQDRVVEQTRVHNNVIPVEHREKVHGKDREVAATLLDQTSKFRDEREVLPVQTSTTTNTVVGEHVHHHIHDIIQPVVEREVIQPHVVHTTVPIHEHIEKAPFIHQGNVLPTMTMDQFSKAGHKLTGFKKNPEHIDYEGEPLKIDGTSNVGFGAGALGGLGAAGAAGGMANSSSTGTGYTTRSGRTRSGSSSSSSSDDGSKVPRTMGSKKHTTTTGTATGEQPKTGLLQKLNPLS